MSISIKYNTYSGNTVAVAPAYNNLNFVVDSTLKSKNEFTYIADVYYSGTTVAGSQFINRMISYPIGTNNYGVFDFHRVLEGVVSYDLNYNTDNIVLAPNSMKRFNIGFGERFSTENTVESISENTTASFSGKVDLTTTYPTYLSANDRVYFDKDDTSTDFDLQGSHLVLTATSTTVTIDFAWSAVTGYTTQTGQLLEGTQVNDTYFYNGDVALLCENTPNIYPGDKIFIDKDDSSINPQYNGYWSVVGVSGSTGDVVITNIPWGSNTTNESMSLFVVGTKLVTGLTYSDNYSWVLNSVEDYEDVGYNGKTQDYKIFSLTGSTSRFLTNAPYTQSVLEGDYHTLSFLNGQDLSSIPTSIRFEINHTSGSTDTRAIYLGSYYNSTDPAETRLDVGVGPGNIDLAITNGNMSGSAINWSTVDNYNVYAHFSGVGTAIISKTYVFDMDGDCSKYDTYRFIWLNRLGGFDYYNFRKRSDENYSIEKSSFNKKLGTLNGDNFGFNSYDRGQTIFNTDVVRSISVNSDWVDEATSEWLLELFTSNEVYVIKKGEEILHPVVITNNSYTIGKRENQKLFNYKVDFVFAYNKPTQRG